MKEYTAAKAEGYTEHGEPIEDYTIIINRQIPKYTNGEFQEHYIRYYDMEASNLVEILINCLPGGTIDRILVKLLEHKASIYRVPIMGQSQISSRTKP